MFSLIELNGVQWLCPGALENLPSQQLLDSNNLIRNLRFSSRVTHVSPNNHLSL
jgi:hypothetical protein